MKKSLILLVLLSGCCEYGYYVRGTHYGHQYDYVPRNYICQRHAITDGTCVCQCRHAKTPLFEQKYEPPVYGPVSTGIDCEGNNTYKKQVIRDGFYREVFIGYYCSLCGRRL